ncbi:MAG: protein kinase, partial [Thermomicrobia bacterium]|nr:protein kinase [Thermomicrobia bacterium]MCA1725146.1 protein kinase [Thermomicrobia bacterium]
TDDTYYIVMEYVPGPNLKETIRARGPLPEGEALGIGAQVAAALGAAHAHHLIHRDIKPHNVLLSPEGDAKVTDFGIARAAGASQLTATQTVMGTAHYLSPEQALHRPLDGRSDLYSLGIVLYEALTGQLPFEGESLVAVAMRQVHDPPPPMRQFAPEITPRTEAVVMRALAKDPADRYQSAGEMQAALIAAAHMPQPAPVFPAIPETAALPSVPPPAPSQPLPVDERPPAPPFTVASGNGRRRLVFVPVIAALCALLALMAVFALHATGGGETATAAPTLAPRTTPTTQASAVVVATIPLTAVPAPTIQASPVSPTAAPTVIAALPTTVPTAVPLPTPTPLALPTATAIPPTAIAPTAIPATAPPPAATERPPATATTNPPAVAGGASSPAEAVQRFYHAVGQHQFDAAAQLWTPQMRAQYPPQENINGHFAATERIDLSIGTVVMTGDGQATVPVELTDVRADGSLHYVGSWQVVRGPSGWLLAQPNLQPT